VQPGRQPQRPAGIGENPVLRPDFGEAGQEVGSTCQTFLSIMRRATDINVGDTAIVADPARRLIGSPESRRSRATWPAIAHHGPDVTFLCRERRFGDRNVGVVVPPPPPGLIADLVLPPSHPHKDLVLRRTRRRTRRRAGGRRRGAHLAAGGADRVTLMCRLTMRGHALTTRDTKSSLPA
jgi:hypothetical protein